MHLLRRFATATAAGFLLANLAAPDALAQVTIDWVTVGDAENAADPATGYGAVDEAFRIAKYLVTIQQYTVFLNAVAAADTYELYNTNMASDLNIAGISRSGSSGSYKYSVMTNDGDSGNRPITHVSWFDAARFANWMANGQPTGIQTGTTTENGAYNVSGAISGPAPSINGTNPNTGLAPSFYMPVENEWYKAAYYSPVLNSGSGGYYTYATQSNAAPGNAIGSGANQANYRRDSLYSVTQSSIYDPNANYLSDVGAFTNSASYYGTFDQSGNLYQWNDLDGNSGPLRGLRGGCWVNNAFDLSSSPRVTDVPSREDGVIGFRLASPVAVPEPSTYAMALAGLACGGFSMLRRRKRMSARRLLVLVAAVTVAVASAGTPTFAQLVNYELVPVGDPGNAPDTTGYGAVPYEYQMGKYEVTIGQYAAFLNAVAKSDPYVLWNASMAAELSVAGISRGGTSGGYVYSVIGPSGSVQIPQATSANRPITAVSWFAAARFANWMSNGQPTGAQGPTTTENGAYEVNGATEGLAPAINAVNPNTGAVPLYRVPTENEWYKAAYYRGGSADAGYCAYATQSDLAPSNQLDPSGANSANYRPNNILYTVTQSSDRDPTQNYLTDVGAFPASTSAYGTLDQSGNVEEWNDLTGESGYMRGLRGGDWNRYFDFLRNSSWTTSYPTNAFDSRGFRLASPVAVPEPSTSAAGLAGLACGYLSMWRRKRA